MVYILIKVISREDGKIEVEREIKKRPRITHHCWTARKTKEEAKNVAEGRKFRNAYCQHGRDKPSRVNKLRECSNDSIRKHQFAGRFYRGLERQSKPWPSSSLNEYYIPHLIADVSFPVFLATPSPAREIVLLPPIQIDHHAVVPLHLSRLGIALDPRYHLARWS